MSLTANFELGANGATIATADPGSLTAWSFVIIGTFNSLTYDNSTSAGETGKILILGGAGFHPCT